MYDDFASVYDTLMDDFDYDAWSAHYLTLIRTVTGGVEVAFVRQDMKKLTLPRRVGAVLATCDGVNYLTTPNDVQAFFAAAYQNLLPGGALCFDCSTRHKLENVMGDAFFGEERDGAAVLWQNKLNREEHLLSMDVTFFVRKEDGCYRRFREQHHQRAHSAEELTAWLCQSGFEDVRIYGEMRMDATKPEDLRMHITAKKPEMT